MAAEKVIIHYLHPDPGGAVKSAGLQLNFAKGRVGGGTFAAACGEEAPLSQVGRVLHQGTSEPWVVNCEACRGTDVFKENDRPHPARAKDKSMVDDRPSTSRLVDGDISNVDEETEEAESEEVAPEEVSSGGATTEEDPCEAC